jgi:hypothetical protein
MHWQNKGLRVDDSEKLIEDLILKGALEVAGIDIETGEPMYNFTEKLKDVDPQLHQEVFTFFSAEALDLWQKGFIDMDVTLSNPEVRLTKKALDQIEIMKLDKDKQFTLRQIVKYILEQ